MAEPVFTSLEECFSDLPDPRVQGRCDHKLMDLIIITVCVVICGADSWTGVETFAKAKEEWLRQYLELPKVIPAHDTLGRVFASLNAEAFQAGFSRWVEAVFRVTKGQVVAIDGKTVRRCHNQTIVRVQREVRVQGKTSFETAYYISTLPNDAAQLLEASRHQWAIENSFHWVLDVTFREDDSRIRSGDSPQNRAVFRHLALNILKQDPSRMSLKQKRFRAGLDNSFLLQLLTRI